MQTVVTFKGDKREIVIDFNLDEETGELNYNVNVNPPINPGDSFNLETHLADTFLGARLGSLRTLLRDLFRPRNQVWLRLPRLQARLRL